LGLNCRAACFPHDIPYEQEAERQTLLLPVKFL
jgi:hypothetical protein